MRLRYLTVRVSRHTSSSARNRRSRLRSSLASSSSARVLRDSAAAIAPAASDVAELLREGGAEPRRRRTSAESDAQRASRSRRSTPTPRRRGRDSRRHASHRPRHGVVQRTLQAGARGRARRLEHRLEDGRRHRARPGALGRARASVWPTPLPANDALQTFFTFAKGVTDGAKLRATRSRRLRISSSETRGACERISPPLGQSQGGASPTSTDAPNAHRDGFRRRIATPHFAPPRPRSTVSCRRKAPALRTTTKSTIGGSSSPTVALSASSPPRARRPRPPPAPASPSRPPPPKAFHRARGRRRVRRTLLPHPRRAPALAELDADGVPPPNILTTIGFTIAVALLAVITLGVLYLSAREALDKQEEHSRERRTST